MRSPFLLLLSIGTLSAESDTPCQRMDLMASVGYTFWVPSEEGLMVAYDTCEKKKSYTIYPQIRGRSGFKLGLGVALDNDGWQINSNYYWFSNIDNELYPRPESIPVPIVDDVEQEMATLGHIESRLNPTWATDVGFLLPDEPKNPRISVMDPLSSITDLSSSWNNYFNRVDLVMTYSLPMKPFTICASGGLIGGWANQHLNVLYRYVFKADNTPSAMRDTTLREIVFSYWKSEQFWWGIGPYMGISPRYTFYDCTEHNCSLLLSAAMGLPWSRISASMKRWRMEEEILVYTTPFIEPIDVPINSYKDDTSSITPMVEMAIGLSCASMNMCGISIDLSLLWHQQVWFAHNHLFSASDSGWGEQEMTSDDSVDETLTGPCYRMGQTFIINKYSTGSGSYTMQGITTNCMVSF